MVQGQRTTKVKDLDGQIVGGKRCLVSLFPLVDKLEGRRCGDQVCSPLSKE